MKDISGNEMPKVMEYSLQNQCYVQGDKLEKAVFILAHACLKQKNTTKEQMRDEINKATDLIIDVRKWLIGR